ncbi:MAG: glycosyltransferase family 4 protein [Thermodesulfobacteriota bacterium]|nr:glycosyltransferase family 4 protein [Thermodesulfobacteriota bacterium]
MKQEKNILMVAYLFPPLGGSGALRPVKLAKYLPEFGWKPIILTPNKADYYYANDPELLKELPSEIKIKRSKMLKAAWIYRFFNPFRLRRIDKIIKKIFLHPDEQIGWIPFAFFSGMNMIRKHNIDAIYSTSGPLSSHLIALLIKKRTGLTWIAEFRDEWFEDPRLDFVTSFHKRLHYRLEKMIINNADRIVTMAPVFARLLSKHNGNSHKFFTITAGYDPKDFTDDSSSWYKEENMQKFVTVFNGVFYDTFKPISFLQAIEELIDEGEISQEEVCIEFVGPNTANDIGTKDKHGICKFIGFVPRKKAIQCLSRADVLLLLLSRERGKDVIPSKIFEYMASGKPILSLIPKDGDSASIIKKTNTGIVADFDDVNEIKDAYLALYQRWKKQDLPWKTNWKEVEKFDQKNLTSQFADILNQGVHSSKCLMTQEKTKK